MSDSGDWESSNVVLSDHNDSKSVSTETSESECGSGKDSDAELRLEKQAAAARVVKGRKNKRSTQKGSSGGHEKGLKDAREHASNHVMTKLLQPLDNNRADFDSLMKKFFRNELKMNPAQVEV